MLSQYFSVFILSLFLVLPTSSALGQPSSAVRLPVSSAAEWQQRVAYDIDVSLRADRHRMTGRQVATYYNNSPDTLDRVYYHLYFNAFHPQSMMAERNRQLPDPDSRIVPRIFELGPDEIGFHRIESLTQDGRRVEFDITDTVMEVKLAAPIPPGGSAEFEMRFHSQIPLQTRRSGRDSDEGIDYSMTQWYPKLANYDERGWHADPYVGREFYAPFGTFDVSITLPAEYTIGATGVLQNAHEIGHGYDTTATASASDSLTWHFRAENVHDFAWAADPDYIHDVITRNGIDHHLLYQPDVAEAWEGLREDLPAIMEFFSANYGEYPYPQVTVVQGGDGGMEYPMITLITGERSARSVLGVTAHEVAHMWYYGALGSNEADYAWMDEGFTSYASSEAIAHLDSLPAASHTSAYRSVLSQQEDGLFERLNTPSDWFRTNSAYSVSAYSGGRMIADMLGYVISDSLRDRFLLEYFDRYKFRHPDPYDMEVVAEDVSGLRLDWFFEQFLNTEWTLDLAVDDVRSRRENDSWLSEIVIERRGDITMPVDLLITFDDGSRQWVNVPLALMQGHKPMPDGWIVADPWLWTFPKYTLTFKHLREIDHVVIDPTLHTPDANRLNNTNRFPARFSFLNAPAGLLTSYNIGWRPVLQYANNFGIGAGLQFRGTYAFDQYRTRAMIKLWPEVLLSGGEEPELSGFFIDDTSPLDGLDFEFFFSDHLEGVGPYGVASLHSQKHIGIVENELSFTTPLRRFDLLRDSEHRVTAGLKHQNSTTVRAQLTQASSGFDSNDVFSGFLAYTFTDERTRLEVGTELGGAVSGSFGGRSANRAYVDAARAAVVGPFTAGARLLVGIGAGNLVPQKLFRLGTASSEDRWSNDAYRTTAAVFEDPLDEAHWIAFAGPGPVAYARATTDMFGVVDSGPIGNNVAAASLVLVAEPFQTHEWLHPLQAELFVGGGEVWASGAVSGEHVSVFEGFAFDDLLFDAGIGFRYDLSDLSALRQWTAQSDVLSGMTLTAKFPLLAAGGDRGGSSNVFDYRWLIGITVDDAPWY